MNNLTYQILIVLLVVCLALWVPIGIIWALNTLFGLSIIYSVKTWAAALLLSMIIGASKK